MYRRDVTIINKTGLHARPAAQFIRQASKFKSDISVIHKGKLFNAKSIISVISAGIYGGSVINISAEGSDEEEAVNSLLDLVLSNFGEQ